MNTTKFDVVGVGLNATDTLLVVPHFPAYAGKAPFTVAGEDISDLRIVTAPYVTATGRVVADPSLLQPSPPGGMSISVIPALPDDMFPGPLRPARLNDDLSFELKSPP